MKILLLTQVLPYPPDSGPKIKTYNLIRYLAARHEVTLVSFTRGNQSAEIACLEKICRRVYAVPIRRSRSSEVIALAKSLFTGRPWIILRDERKAMRELVAGLLHDEHFDALHIDQLNMAQFVEPFHQFHRVLDAHNALWVLYKRMAETTSNPIVRLMLQREWRLLKVYEGEIGRSFTNVTAVSEEDRAALIEAIGVDGKISTVPIAVDVEEITPLDRDPNARHIVHIGTMFWPPNVDGILWFAKEVYPRIKARLPEIAFDVIGARPPQSVLKLAGLGNDIHVVGYVADPSSYLRQAGVMVVPLRFGGGMRVKILTALAQAMPIVSTSIGCEGIGVENGRHLLVADTPEEFAACVQRLLENRELAAELGRNGRRLIETVYDYRTAYRPLDQVYTV